MINRIFFLMSLWLFIDLYFFQAVSTAAGGHAAAYWAYWLFDGAVAAIILFFIFSGRLAHRPRSLNYVFGLMLLSLVPKLVGSPVLLLEDVGRLLAGAFNWAGDAFSPGGGDSAGGYFPGRSRIMSMLALGVAAVPFTGIIYGVAKGRYQYTVRRIKLAFPDLPDAFNGFTITQLSDIHSGSFDNKAAVAYGVDLANRQHSDLFVFTGDLVNNVAAEMDPWIDTFSNLKAPMGQFSILGNHDYGDYIQWPDARTKAENLESLKAVHKKIGFRLLLNERITLEKDGQRINLIGVENWGKGGFAKYGDLQKAAAGLQKDSFNILLSHDPSHWEAEVLPHPEKIHLTLSGHTHGMQFGVELPGFRWSPIKYVYPQWAGVYERAGRYLYVNRGFGFLGFPGRVGILPEITVITLVKGGTVNG